MLAIRNLQHKFTGITKSVNEDGISEIGKIYKKLRVSKYGNRKRKFGEKI